MPVSSEHFTYLNLPVCHGACSRIAHVRCRLCLFRFCLEHADEHRCWEHPGASNRGKVTADE
jgi:hypothetical protein